MTIRPSIRVLLKEALQEDLGSGDLTTQALIPRNQRARAAIVAKESGIFAGGRVAWEVFRLHDPRFQVKLLVKEGGRVKKGQKVMMLQGRTQSILEAERTALNFLGHLSGIATLTRRYVDKIRGTKAKIYDTRKTTPLWRELERYAVRCGGGANHRFGLFDEILVKENHLAANDVHWFRTLATAAKRRRIPIEVEVRNLKELARLLSGLFVPDRILLDNFSLCQLRRAVLFVRGLDYVLRTRYGIRLRTAGARRAVPLQGQAQGLPLLEASGGITLENVRRVAQTGVDRISVGRLTHSAPALDFSLAILC